MKQNVESNVTFQGSQQYFKRHGGGSRVINQVERPVNKKKKKRQPTQGGYLRGGVGATRQNFNKSS
jgi:hypothetical protein